VIANVLTGRRATWIVLAFSVIVLVLLSPVTGKLKSVQNDDSINYLPRGAQSTQVQQILADLPVGNTADFVVVYARTGGLTGPDLARVAAARTAVANGVDLAAPLGPVVGSTDHAAALFRVPLSGAADALPDKVGRIRDLTASTGDLTVAVTGPGAAKVDSTNQFAGVDLTLLLAAAAVVALLLLLIYRSPILWLLPLVSGGLAVVVAMSATYALARWAGLTVTALSSGILYVLVFGVGTDYALLLVSRYREQLRRHEDHRHAMAQALRSACATDHRLRRHRRAQPALPAVCLGQLRPRPGSGARGRRARRAADQPDHAACVAAARRASRVLAGRPCPRLARDGLSLRIVSPAATQL